MHLYIEEMKLGNYANISFYTALEAYYNMGFEVTTVSDWESLEIKDDNIFLGSIAYMHQALKKMGIPLPNSNDYPLSLRKFLKREVWTSTINTIAANPEDWGVFVKPKTEKKKFVGRLIQSTKDLVSCGDLEDDTEIWVSDPINFVAEWRVFVRYGRVLSVRPYKGNWRANFDPTIIEEAIASFENPPAAYALDFGLTDKGEFALVEFNDGYSLGSYGLFYIDYAKLLSARWAEITKQQDLCYF
jgi:hypothetical protein